MYTTYNIVLFLDPRSADGHDSTNPSSRSGCDRPQPKYRRSGLEITIEWKEAPDDNSEKKTKLLAERVLSIFKSIDDATCLTLGMDPTQARPEWMIITVLPVPPMVV